MAGAGETNGSIPALSSKDKKSSFPWGPPPRQPEMPFNPFLNNSVPITAPWELARTLLMLPIVCFRIVVFLFCFLFGWVVANVVLVGTKDIFTKPFPKWRRNLLCAIKPAVRTLLWSLGYNWIKVKGKVAKREVAPILVSNHVTSIEPVYFFMAHLPMIVTAKENLNIPVAGVVMKALQVVALDRSSPTSRKDAAGEIKRRAMCNDWAPVLLFPEATTTNGRSLVSFKLGAFNPGLTVQPVVVQYPHTNLDPSWVCEGMPTPLLIFRLMCNLNNEMVVEYLDPIFPTPAEQKHPRLFAERTRVAMAKKLNVTMTEHSFGDVALALEAQKLKLPVGTTNVEFGRFERLFHLTLPEAKAYLRRFRRLDLTNSGVVTYHDFVEALDLPDTHFTRTVFELLDSDGDGVVNFREFVGGLAFISRHPEFQSSVKSLFDKLDVDHDGKISAEDARTGLPKIFPAVSKEQVEKLACALLNTKEAVAWDDFRDFLKLNPEYLALALAAQVSD